MGNDSFYYRLWKREQLLDELHRVYKNVVYRARIYNKINIEFVKSEENYLLKFNQGFLGAEYPNLWLVFRVKKG